MTHRVPPIWELPGPTFYTRSNKRRANDSHLLRAVDYINSGLNRFIESFDPHLPSPNSSSSGRSDASIFPPVIILSLYGRGGNPHDHAASARLNSRLNPIRLTDSHLKSHPCSGGGHTMKLMKLKVRIRNTFAYARPNVTQTS